MPKQSRDLFDETTMTFGEHLDVLRIHLWKAIIGIVMAVIVTLIFGIQIFDFVRAPIDAALRRNDRTEDAVDDMSGFDPLDAVKKWWNGEEPGDATEKDPPEELPDDSLVVKIDKLNLIKALNDVSDEKIETGTIKPDEHVEVIVQSPEIAEFRATLDRLSQPAAFNPQEGFMVYMKVSLIAGLLLASPWVFYQVWQFVAAGLYRHERRYVYFYLPMSLGLFLIGAWFCFVYVFPVVLDFLLGFNNLMGLNSTIRISEWVSFAMMMPMMFGISFQLPLVMMFLERINVFDQNTYRERRRVAVLVNAFLSMILTPQDPTSMLMMFIPLVLLYELGIVMCGFTLGDPTPTEPVT